MKKRRGGAELAASGSAGGAAASGGILANLGIFGLFIKGIMACTPIIIYIISSIPSFSVTISTLICFGMLYIFSVAMLKITNIGTGIMNVFVAPVINFFLMLIKILTGQKGKPVKIKIPKLIEEPFTIFFNYFIGSSNNDDDDDEDEDGDEDENKCTF